MCVCVCVCVCVWGGGGGGVSVSGLDIQCEFIAPHRTAHKFEKKGGTVKLV